ncbi:MAG TPA: TonB-dependent receptor [Acidobacteriaceae bacterium]|nr:TonB-dependent receptor [Acidobacteriaceae bacterium]
MLARPLSGRRLGVMLALSAGIFLTSFFSSYAAVVHGTVTDPLGAPIAGATVALVSRSQVIAQSATQHDGTYRLTTSVRGRFYVLASAGTFKQVSTQSFYAGPVDAHQEDIVMEPAVVRQEIVVSATGTPTPQAQLGPSVSVQRNPEFRNRIDLVDPLRQSPGVFLVQQGQYGGLASLFVRGGSSSSNQVNLDGVPIDDIGGVFDLSNVSTMGVEKLELYRGPNSVLYGSDAASSVLNLSTPRGSTAFPSLFYEGDYGNLTTFRNQLQLGGTHNKIDYYGGFSAFQSNNDLPMDKYHDDTASGNLGYAFNAATQIRVTARNSDSASGTPGPIDFYGIPNAGKQSDQDTYLSGTIDSQTSEAWHNMVRYGMARKREEDVNFYAAGIPITTTVDGYTSTNYYGYATVIRGANGYSTSGQAVLSFAGVFPNRLELVSNRDQLYFQSNYSFTQHIGGLFGFRFEDERGAEKSAAYAIDQTVERANYDYTAQIQGDFHNRVYYTLGGGVEKNQLFGTVGTPHIGLAYYPVRPGRGVARGTKIKFNFANGYQEPSLEDQFGSLYNFLLGQQGGAQAIRQFHVSPIGAQDSRTYEGGVEQSFFNERVALRVSYFHNQYRNQIESVPATEVPALLPGLSAAQQSVLKSYLINGPGIDLNSQAFRAQGMESEIEYGMLHDLFLRGGYTYLDAVVQRSFSSDALQPSFNTGPPGGPAPSFSGLPIGAFGPLRGARPFRRPPHVGFLSINYTGTRWGGQLTGSFASRSDDSTFLPGYDFWGGNSLLLPNRNLDYGYAKLDAGGSYQFTRDIGVYIQLNNLTNNQHIGPVGYPALPFTFRAGLRLALGHQRP